ncbi:hypothetical protein [Mycolicibacterium komossense]|uniref:Uncharacterized protein n=1 Tax=Mycolicibacterium komossense TaxID=1779 RepID=A0ABT3CEN8_9MYCO|nr:hypothetical protein [Mycolicibacterium komossense]MCV7227954.1 hypothetical protein [Mycolicibacterium komossense]
MLPDQYREFFIAGAGAAAALIGLLFVAVSVFPEQARQATTRVQFQSRASAALLVFSNALVISLSALVPGVSLGWWATAAATSVLLFAAGAARTLAGDTGGKRHRGESLWLIVGLLLIGGFEMYAGIRLIAGPDLDPVRTLNYVIIGDLLYGISRAWRLVGLHDTGWWSSVLLIAGHTSAKTGEPES